MAVPYAPTRFEGRRAHKVCPVCREKVQLKARKDHESFSGIEYALHIERLHPEQVVPLTTTEA